MAIQDTTEPQVNSCEFRRLGDAHALVTVAARADGATRARLRVGVNGAVREVAAVAVTHVDDATRFRFVVDRGDHDAALAIAIGDASPLPLSPVLTGDPVGAADDRDELFDLLTVFEKRCAIAERVADDRREAPSDARKLAQAYREASELRALLDEHAGAVAACKEREAHVAALEAELHETTRDLNDRAGAVDVLTAEADELAQERDAAQALGAAWSVEAERARNQLADAVTRAEELEQERDAVCAEAETVAGELVEARRTSESRAAELEDARGTVAPLRDELEAARAATADAEGALERERALYEARIASGVETERKLSQQVEELKARLGERRQARGDLPHRPEEQREWLRRTSLEEQRAQVAALEAQLDRLKQRSAASTTP